MPIKLGFNNALKVKVELLEGIHQFFTTYLYVKLASELDAYENTHKASIKMSDWK